MIEFNRSLHICNASINDVLCLLSECQLFTYTRNEKYVDEIRNKINETDGTFQQFIKLMTVIKKRKNEIVLFYVYDEQEYISIYSDFFELDGAFDFMKKVFSKNEYIAVWEEIHTQNMHIRVSCFDDQFHDININLLSKPDEDIFNIVRDAIIRIDELKEKAEIVSQICGHHYKLNHAKKSIKKKHLESCCYIEEYIV